MTDTKHRNEKQDGFLTVGPPVSQIRTRASSVGSLVRAASSFLGTSGFVSKSVVAYDEWLDSSSTLDDGYDKIPWYRASALTW